MEMREDTKASAPVKSERQKNRRFRWAVAESLVALVLVVVAGFTLVACTIEIGSPTTTATAGPATTVLPPPQEGTPPISGDHTGQTVTTLPGTAQRIASPAAAVGVTLGPSVVNIATSGTVEGIFGRQRFTGEGSGVIYTSDGMIITNNHVITDDFGDPVSNIEVTLTTGEKLSATIVGRDLLTDLAVIRVDAGRELPAATFATELPTVGEYAVAIGSPLGYENSVTLGIVSGLARSIDGVGGLAGLAYTNLIQTDAPISPGNSGGALANALGHVIGINVAYLPPQYTGAMNIGFAIPSVVATEVADEILATGRATHAYLGVGTQTVTTELARQFGLSRASGILVAEVASGGPADRVGIRQGDIIYKIDDKDIVESSDLLIAIRDRNPGDRVQVTFDREGTEKTVTATLQERPVNLR